MGTWIAHLRIAEKIAESLPGLNLKWFYAGSIAPDCGMPDETWAKFDPPKSVTHYLVQAGSRYLIRDLAFYNEYRKSIHQDISETKTSFLWGYYIHLLTDRLWIERIDPTTKAEWADLITEMGKSTAIELIKGDWYDLDHRFLRDHPGWLPWKIFMDLKFPEFPIHHISPDAINFQFDTIRQYYTDSGNHRSLDRPYPYMNGHTMQRLVDDCAAVSLKIYHLLQGDFDLGGASSAVDLLLAEERAPYPPPLGDK